MYIYIHTNIMTAITIIPNNDNNNNNNTITTRNHFWGAGCDTSRLPLRRWALDEQRFHSGSTNRLRGRLRLGGTTYLMLLV